MAVVCGFSWKNCVISIGALKEVITSLSVIRIQDLSSHNVSIGVSLNENMTVGNGVTCEESFRPKQWTLIVI